MANEIAKQVDQIRGMNPQEVSELTVNVVDVTKTLNETNNEMDILSRSLYKLNETKDKYDEKVKNVRQQLTDLAVKF